MKSSISHKIIGFRDWVIIIIIIIIIIKSLFKEDSIFSASTNLTYMVKQKQYLQNHTNIYMRTYSMVN